MNNQINDETPTALEERSRQLFDDSVARLNAHARSRLNQARHAALEAARPNRRARVIRWLLPTGSIAALALIAVVALQFFRVGDLTTTQPTSALATSPLEDMEIVASADELDLLQNDLEFYDWLDSPEAALPAGEST